jgi:ankyrin repeat protein
MAFGTVFDNAHEFVDKKDAFGRTALIATAASGCKSNATKLLSLRTGTSGLEQVTKYGESAIFYALRSRHWDYLEAFCPLTIKEDDYYTYQLLKARAKANDQDFFKKLLSLRIGFNERAIMRTAIEYNHVWFVENWKNINGTYALHDACFFGRDQIVKQLICRDDLKINQPDPTNANRSALYLCHINAIYSELNNEYNKREWVPEEVYSDFEYKLLKNSTY